MTKRYDNVTDLLESMTLPAAQKKRQTDYIKARQLSRMLTVMRAHKELSQKDAAKKLGWSQSRVSKLETKEDRSIAIGDLLDYSDALGMELSLVFLPKKMKIVDRVKMHAFEMVELLQRLASLSKGDEKMVQGVHHFHEECMGNMIRMIEDSRKTLRPKPSKELTVIGPPQVDEMIEKEQAALARA
jgi:transcriptional regulator with XRE-family HTH domain